MEILKRLDSVEAAYIQQYGRKPSLAELAEKVSLDWQPPVMASAVIDAFYVSGP